MSEKPFKIIISPSGDITSVYSDRMSLTKLGTAYIHRATDVKFNNKEEHWDVIGIPPVFEKRILLANWFSVRANAILWEIEYLNKHMESIIESYPKGGYLPGELQVFNGKEA